MATVIYPGEYEPPTEGLAKWQWVVTAIVVIILIVIGIAVFGKDKSAEPDTLKIGTNVWPSGAYLNIDVKEKATDGLSDNDTPFTFEIKGADGMRYTTHAYIIVDNCVKFKDESGKRTRVCGNFSVVQQ